MNVQAAPSPYIPVGGTHTQPGSPPVLGSQMLGATGGLPQSSGLSATQNPMADKLQSMGRGEDTMLVHMTPEEVNSLQGLAMAAGGSLSINPQTGLPEASFLKKLLPMIAGIGLNFVLPGSGGIVGALGGKAATAGLLTGAASTALTGDLNKGLMAGLQAFGGASLGGGLESAFGSGAKAASGTAGVPGLGQAAEGTVQNAFDTAFNVKSPGVLSQFGEAAKGTMSGFGAKAAPMAAGMGVLSALSDATTPKVPGLAGEENRSPYVPMGPGKRQVRFQTPEQMRESGGAEFSYFTPSNPDPVPLAEGGAVGSPQQDFNSLVAMYQSQNPGAITASMFPTPSASPTGSSTPATNAPPAGILPSRGREVMHDFNRPTPVSPPAMGLGTGLDTAFERLFGGSRDKSSTRSDAGYIGQRPAFRQRMASGGSVDMDNGSFVVDARTVSELGNGSSNAGIEMLSRLGGRPVQGPGDGVSDSVKASIGGSQEARVARDEVIFSSDAVRRLGGGSDKRGTQKLYAMMEKAHKARKKAGRGQDTKLRKGLA